MNRKIWEVDIDIIGPITIAQPFGFKQEKGFDRIQFYSDIRFRNNGRGISSTVTAYAENCDFAQTVAFVFIGRMVDILSLENNIPLILSLPERSNKYNYNEVATTRRLLENVDFMAAFKVARRLETENPVLLKAIGWYSKARASINTLDQFLSFWTSIEVAATEYHTHTERTTNGVINKVYQCFLDYFGGTHEWGVPETWINQMHDQRSRIAHGAEETTAETINNVAQLVPELEEVSRRLIYAILTRFYPDDIFKEAFASATF